MAPTLVTVGTALLACAGNAVAKKWYLEDTYDATNFFDKFDFFESKYDTGNLNDIDPTGGHVNYQSRKNAVDKGLIKYKNNEVYIGVDKTSILPGAYQPGRPSVRIESKARFNHGLLIARFTHLPENKCGVWPAVWTYGQDWPNDGEIDFYEEWNNSPWNQPALHTNNSPKYGQCILDGEGQTSGVLTDNCDNSFANPPFQYNNQGCVSAETDGPWASKDGGVYAMEWTSDYIKLFSWKWSDVPKNIDTDSPDTAAWGTPSVFLKNKHCNIDRHFSNQRLVLNINFCGVPAGLPDIWGQSCKKETNYNTCVDYISKNPGHFDNVFFQVKDIRYFTGTAPPASTTSLSSTSSASSTSTSSSATSSTLSTSSSSSSASSSSSSSSSAVTSSTVPASTSSTSSLSTSAVSGTSSSASSSAVSSATSSSANSASVTGGVSSSASESVPATTSSTASASSGASGASSIPSVTLPPTGRWSNSSSLAVPTVTASSSGSSVDLTTSTVYTTKVHTVTKCPPWVNCPAGGYVTTETIPLYTTVCPVTKVPSATAKATLTTSAETITTTVSSIYTVTSCPPSVVDCHVGHVTTEIITTTYCPGAQESQPPTHSPETITTTQVYTITSCPPSVPNCPIGSVTTDVITTTYSHPGQTDVPPPQSGDNSLTVPPPVYSSQTAVTVPKPSGSNNGTVPIKPSDVPVKPSHLPIKPSPVPSQPGCTGPGCPNVPSSDAGKLGASAFVAAAGALLAFMI